MNGGSGLGARGSGLGRSESIAGARARLFAVAMAVAIGLPLQVGSFAQLRPARIISLIPAVTEMLFAIDAGDRVVAVSSFDEYPPQVRNLERVGALLDPDLERILALKPDLVAIYASQTDLQRQLERAGIATYTYKHAGLADVVTTLRSLGARVGREQEAARAIAAIERGLQNVRQRVAGRPRPKTMLVFGREAMTVRGVYASGGVGFLHDMLVAAGGENLFADVRRESVQATSELILARRPEAIIELRVGEITEERKRAEIDAWSALASVPAVRSNRVYFITDPRTVVPGPRVAEGTELLARALHPEAFR
jgi:iron complex transport system substrate-binding protein